MTVVLGSNIAALKGVRRLADATRLQTQASARLATGLRINRASDDAAGLAISSLLNTDARVYGQAIRNVNDVISALNIAEGSVQQLSFGIGRLQELATQAANGTLGRTQRLALDREFGAISSELNRILQTTNFNGRGLLNNPLESISAALGYSVTDGITVNFGQGLGHNVGTGQYGAANAFGFNTLGGPAVGDVNGDGRDDAVFTNDVSNVVRVCLNNGSGGFNIVNINITAPVSAEVGDFDGDGNDEIATLQSNGTLSIYKQTAPGTFSVISSRTITATANTRLVAEDMDGNGSLDLIAYEAMGTAINTYLNNGGNFVNGTSITAASTIKNVAAGDFNGDGIGDLSFTSNAVSTGWIYEGRANNTLALVQTFTLGTSNHFVEVGDLDHDGKDEIVTSGGIYLKAGASGYTQTSTGATPQAATLRLGDVNGDGFLDLLQYDYATDLQVYLGRGDGSFGPGQGMTVGNGIHGLGLLDIDGDGVNDLLYGRGGGAQYAFASITTSTNIQRLSIRDKASALETLTELKKIAERVSKSLGTLGAGQSRLETAVQGLSAMRLNVTEAQSRIQDADIAEESMALVRANILQNVGAAILSQANQLPALALKLLRG